MDDYCAKNNINPRDERQKMLDKYNIKTRSSLTEIEIDHEIKSYEAGLYF